MTIADVLATVVALFLLGLGFGAFGLILDLFVPSLVERAARHVSERPLSSFFLGLGLLLAVLVTSAVLVKAPLPPARLAAIGLLLAGLTLAALGGTGLALHIGRRYREAAKLDPSPRDLFRGTVLLESAVAFPIVGWFVVFPVAFLVTLGAGLRSLFTPRAEAA